MAVPCNTPTQLGLKEVHEQRNFWETFSVALSIFCLSQACRGAEACPPDANAPGVQISVAALRENGTTPVGGGTVAPGEAIVLRASIYYLPIDPLTGGTLSAVEQGRLTISLNGLSTDVTPPGGVPVVGPISCGGMPVVHSRNLTYVVTEADASAGGIVVRADYTGGVARMAFPVDVHVTAHARVRVRPAEVITPAGPLAIQRIASGNILLSFSGQSWKTYRIEASTDLTQWTSLGVVTPDPSGRCQLEDLEIRDYPQRFYRYVVEN